MDPNAAQFYRDLYANAKDTGKAGLRGAITGVLGLPADLTNAMNLGSHPARLTSEMWRDSLGQTYPNALGDRPEAQGSARAKMAEFVGEAVTPGPEAPSFGSDETRAQLKEKATKLWEESGKRFILKKDAKDWQ